MRQGQQNGNCPVHFYAIRNATSYETERVRERPFCSYRIRIPPKSDSHTQRRVKQRERCSENSHWLTSTNSFLFSLQWLHKGRSLLLYTIILYTNSESWWYANDTTVRHCLLPNPERIVWPSVFTNTVCEVYCNYVYRNSRFRLTVLYVYSSRTSCKDYTRHTFICDGLRLTSHSSWEVTTNSAAYLFPIEYFQNNGS